VKKDPEISAIALPDSERQDHVPRLLAEALQSARGRDISPYDARAAALHGVTRRKQGHSVPLLIREAKLLQDVIGECVKQNLLAIDVSHLIPDLIRVWGTITTELEFSVQAFLESDSTPSKSRKRRSPTKA
jgi:hypothetical protein